jgi:hypothetical protein
MWDPEAVDDDEQIARALNLRLAGQELAPARGIGEEWCTGEGIVELAGRWAKLGDGQQPLEGTESAKSIEFGAWIIAAAMRHGGAGGLLVGVVIGVSEVLP